MSDNSEDKLNWNEIKLGGGTIIKTNYTRGILVAKEDGKVVFEPDDNGRWLISNFGNLLLDEIE